jgi:nucleoside-diphosphate-sugar epimerase
MRVLITGATGFIGARLRRRLAQDGHTVICATRTAPPVEPPNASCEWIQWDDAASPCALPARGVDAVMYLAQSRNYRDFPGKAREMFAVNATALLAVLDWARRERVGAFVYTSSANVYGASERPLCESVQLAPDSFYGRTKQIGEMLVGSYAAYFQCTIFRLFTVYGEGQTGMLVPALVSRVRNGEAIQLQGSAGLRLSPLYVDEATQFLTRALDGSHARETHVFNLGGPEAVDLRQIGEQIGEALGRDPIFETRGGPEPGGWVADMTRLRETFGCGPVIGFREGLRRMLAEQREAF